MQKLYKLMLVGFLLLLLAGLFLLAAFRQTNWEEDFANEDGRLGMAYFTNVDWRYWGSPHVLSIGGDRISSSATFHLDGHSCTWSSERDERVFSVQLGQQWWYAISLDRSDGHKWIVRFYSGKDHGPLKEIKPQEYPIKLAIQNLWLTDEVISVNSAFSSQGSFARTSLLASTWWKILHSEDVKEVKHGFIEEVAAREFPGRKSFLPPQQNK